LVGEKRAPHPSVFRKGKKVRNGFPHVSLLSFACVFLFCFIIIGDKFLEQKINDANFFVAAIWAFIGFLAFNRIFELFACAIDKQVLAFD